MKKTPAKIKVQRIGNSPYFKKDFLQTEQSVLATDTRVEVLPYSPLNQMVDPPDVVITNTHVQLNHDHLNLFSSAKLFIHANSGHDNYHFDFVKNCRAPIILGNEIRKNAVANYILSVLFEHYSSVPKHHQWDEKREWHRTLLNQKNILIIGLGNIGNILANSLRPLCHQLFIYDPFKNYSQLPQEEIDIIIPVCGLNPTSHHLIDQAFLKNCSSDFLLINASRGEIVKTSDLITCLQLQKNACAYLDVFEKEPNDFQEFKNLNNLFTTSHIAGVFKDIDSVTIQFEQKIISDFLDLELENFSLKYADIILQNKIQSHFLI